MDQIRHVKDEVMGTVEENLEETKRFIQVLEKDNMELAQKIETLTQLNRFPKDQQMRTENVVLPIETQMLRDIIELERAQNATLQTENNRLWQKDNDMELNYGDLQQELGFQRFKYNHLLANYEKKIGLHQKENYKLLLQTARLQTKIKNLKRKNKALQRKIEDLQTEKDELKDLEKYYKYLFSHLNSVTEKGGEEKVEVEEKKDERVKDLQIFMQEDVYPEVDNVSLCKRLKRFISRRSEKISKDQNSFEMQVLKSHTGSIDMEWNYEGHAEPGCSFTRRDGWTGE